MTANPFVPTHEVSRGGTSAWQRPDPALPPDNRLEAEVPVMLLDETTGWAHVRCHNGWETWVDARTLVPIDVPVLPPSFAVPDEGLDAFAALDGSQVPVARLDPRLPLAVVAAEGDWLKVRASNGWEAWVRAGTLVPLEG